MIFFVEKSEILGGFYLEQKKTFFCIKKKHFAENREKREKNSADFQMFSGYELNIRAFWEKKGQCFHHIIMIFGSKSENFRGGGKAVQYSWEKWMRKIFVHIQTQVRNTYNPYVGAEKQ